MTSLVLELFGLIGSVASLVGLYVSVLPREYQYGLKDGALLSISLLLIGIACFLRVRDYIAARPVFLHPGREIRDYMYGWISQGAHVLVFSHDLTWVNDEDMRELLRGKARRQELSVCLRDRSQFIDELSNLGARIFTYGELNYVPESRFTIINQGRSDAHVAIGRSAKGLHVVREVASGQDPLFSLARDLAEVVMRLSGSRHEPGAHDETH